MKKILKFYSETCSPCKLMSQRLEELKEKVGIINIDIADEDETNRLLIDKYKVKTVPTIVVLTEDNGIIEIFRGVVSTEKIEEALHK